jgi:hypothetical protein
MNPKLILSPALVLYGEFAQVNTSFIFYHSALS